eukprot:5651726-Prymnesium_polylepis.1
MSEQMLEMLMWAHINSEKRLSARSARAHISWRCPVAVRVIVGVHSLPMCCEAICLIRIANNQYE